MCVLGQSRRFGWTTATSVYPDERTFLRIGGHVSKVPTRDSCIATKDHRVGTGAQPCFAEILGNALVSTQCWTSAAT
jgi:hypothetical protein